MTNVQLKQKMNIVVKRVNNKFKSNTHSVLKHHLIRTKCINREAWYKVLKENSKELIREVSYLALLMLKDSFFVAGSRVTSIK